MIPVLPLPREVNRNWQQYVFEVSRPRVGQCDVQCELLNRGRFIRMVGSRQLRMVIQLEATPLTSLVVLLFAERGDGVAFMKAAQHNQSAILLIVRSIGELLPANFGGRFSSVICSCWAAMSAPVERRSRGAVNS